MRHTPVFIFWFTLILLLQGCGNKDSFTLKSPDGSIVMKIRTADSVTYSVSRGGETVLLPSAVGLFFRDGTSWGNDAKVVKARKNSVRETVEAPLYRQSLFESRYNEMELRFDDGYSITFRAFDEGVAYRFATETKGVLLVAGEQAEFNFAGDHTVYPAYTNGFTNAFQSVYEKTTLSGLKDDGLMLTPVAVDCGPAGIALICESDLESYPGMFLEKNGNGFKGVYAAVPDSIYLHERRCQAKVATRHDHIARVECPRNFPWRIVAVAEKAVELPVNNMVYALASENRTGDVSWIKGGKVAWEWWNHWGLKDVDFKTGINNPTYKAYIDFAADHGLEYVIFDEGWSDPKAGDVMSVINEIDLPGLIAYAENKGVGLMLWVVGNVLDDKLEEACAHYSRLGIKGFKVDFIDRDDQKAVEMVYRIAEAAARHKLLLNLHGIYKPTGLNRTFPNIVNFEGVFGMEELKWSNPDMPLYDVTFPYIRMVQGPVDYTQGAFRNATREGFEINYYEPMSQGTRAHQVATYIVFDSPLSMLCDSPSQYMRDEECTRYIASIPVVYDRTEIIDGEIGEYIVTARRKGGDWYVGGLTSWTGRTLELAMSFLDPDTEYAATMLSDNYESAETPEKYTISEQKVNSDGVLTIPMSPGGGFAIKLIKKQ